MLGQQLLFYASPVLLNSSLVLVVRFKDKHSRYTQIAQGLGFTLGVLAAGLVLNLVVGVLEWRHGYWVPGAVHLALVVGSVACYLWFRFH